MTNYYLSFFPKYCEHYLWFGWCEHRKSTAIQGHKTLPLQMLVCRKVMENLDIEKVGLLHRYEMIFYQHSQDIEHLRIN